MALEKANINQFGNGFGLLYITGEDKSEWINTGITNNSEGVDFIKRDALNRAPVGIAVNPIGFWRFTSISVGGNITTFDVQGVNQITNNVAISAGLEEDAATDLAAEINASVPATGVRYRATAVGDTVYLTPILNVGATVNGDRLGITTTATITTESQDIEGGQNGNELYSLINGRRYWMDADYDSSGCSGAGSATEGDLTTAIEITEYVIKRGLETSLYSEGLTITDESVLSYTRVSAIQHLVLSNSGVTNLKYLTVDGVGIGDIVILQGKNFAATLQDVTTVTNGNIKLANQEDFVATDNTDFIALKAVVDTTYGVSWTEIFRSKVSIADNAVTTAKINNLAVTTDKVALLNITTALINDLAVTTAKINDLAVTGAKIAATTITTDKVALLAITTALINDLAITTAKINDLAITTAKIADSNVTLDKLASTLRTEIITIPVSFEANEQGDIKVELPYDCEVFKISAAVVKNIEATDDATIVPKNQALTIMTDGTIDFTSGDTIGTQATSAPSANNTFAANDTLTLTTSKVTVGGKALVSIHLNRINPVS
jgi:hypothetical protein